MLESILVVLIAPLILIESREAILGFWSLPAVTAAGLIILGCDPVFVLSTAFLVHLCYHRRVASGTARFPEYSYAYWLVCWFVNSLPLSFSKSGLVLPAAALLLIIALSRWSALLLEWKRRLLVKISGENPFFENSLKKVLVVSLFMSYLIFLIPGVSLFLLGRIISCLTDSVLLLNTGWSGWGIAAVLLFLCKDLFLSLKGIKTNIIFFGLGILGVLLYTLLIG